MIRVRTDRGLVRVVDKDCARRSCLHSHWDTHPSSERIKADGSKVATFELICQRNASHGCPVPLPAPAPKGGAA